MGYLALVSYFRTTFFFVMIDLILFFKFLIYFDDHDFFLFYLFVFTYQIRHRKLTEAHKLITTVKINYLLINSIFRCLGYMLTFSFRYYRVKNILFLGFLVLLKGKNT